MTRRVTRTSRVRAGTATTDETSARLDGQAAPDPRESDLESVPPGACRARSYGGTCRVGHQLASARVQLRGRPEGDEPVPQLDARTRPRTRGGCERDVRAGGGARDACVDRPRGNLDEILKCPPSRRGRSGVTRPALIFTMLLLGHFVLACVPPGSRSSPSPAGFPGSRARVTVEAAPDGSRAARPKAGGDGELRRHGGSSSGADRHLPLSPVHEPAAGRRRASGPKVLAPLLLTAALVRDEHPRENAPYNAARRERVRLAQLGRTALIVQGYLACSCAVDDLDAFSPNASSYASITSRSSALTTSTSSSGCCSRRGWCSGSSPA